MTTTQKKKAKKLHEYSSLPKKSGKSHAEMPGMDMEKTISKSIGMAVGTSLGLATLGVVGGVVGGLIKK